jgi:transcriptional regulator of heat shock response
MISERQGEIIKRLVREYIKTAEPVSSKFLSERHDFGLCPSSIRIELQYLINEGYLEQPHTSAGRIPTDKAYRFFVDGLIEEKNEKNESIFQKTINKNEDALRTASLLAKALSDMSSSFIALNLGGITIKEGFDEIVKKPESRNEDFISSFSELIESLEDNMQKLNRGTGVKIYIGQENLNPRWKNISIISSECNLHSEKATISMLGPKRMDYKKNISLINSLNKILEDLYD